MITWSFDVGRSGRFQGTVRIIVVFSSDRESHREITVSCLIVHDVISVIVVEGLSMN